jgi:hypothetical protein
MSPFDDIYREIDRCLGFFHPDSPKRIATKKSWKTFCEQDPTVDWAGLVRRVADLVESHWSPAECGGKKENWRAAKKLKMADHNSGEKKLEKRIAKVPGWWNQVPTCSGVYSSKENRKRSVDLVHVEGRTLELVELKFKLDPKRSYDTPLWAAFEVLIYGLLYRFSHTNRETLRYTQEKNPLVFTDYERVALKVLAPIEYYDAADDEGVRRLENGLNAGLAALPVAPYQLTFGFESFDIFGDAVCQAIVTSRAAVVTAT